MKAGMPAYATQNPCHAPTATPTTSAATMPTHHGWPCWITRTAETAPVSATTEPTDRSMCPPMIRMTIPIARTRMYEYWRTMLVMLPGLSSTPSVRTAKSATMTTRAT